MRAIFLTLLCACTGIIDTGKPGSTPRTFEPVDCTTTTVSTAEAYEGLRAACVGCHSASAEYKFFASQASFEASLVRNPNFVVPGQVAQSKLLQMLAAAPGALQMPPTAPYLSLTQSDASLISLGRLQCWVAALSPTSSVAPPLAASLNRRLYAEYIKRNLFHALGLSESDFSTGGYDYGLEDPDGLSPRAPRNQARAQTLGAPHWLQGVQRDNSVGTAFIQITVQLSQAWCLRAADGNAVFYKYATSSDGLSLPASAPKVRQNLAYLFERVTGEAPDEETMQGLSALFSHYEPTGTRTAWAAACAGIVRHPLSVSF